MDNRIRGFALEVTMTFSKLALTVFVFTIGFSTQALGRGDDSSLQEKLHALNFQRAGPVNWIKYHQISGWHKLDDRHVIITAGESGDFLLKLRRPCKHLDPTLKVTFSATVGNLTTADRINIQAENGLTEYCYITRINRLEQIRESESE